MSRRHTFISPTAVRTYVNQRGRRISGAVLLNLDAYVRRKLDEMIVQHNGGKKTLDVEVAAYVGVRP